MENTLICTKDHMYGMLNIDCQKNLIENMQTVLDAVQLTSGLWLECTYGYKAIELMQLIINNCDRLNTNEAGVHYATRNKLETLKNTAYQTQEFFHKNRPY